MNFEASSKKLVKILNECIYIYIYIFIDLHLNKSDNEEIFRLCALTGIKII